MPTRQIHICRTCKCPLIGPRHRWLVVTNEATHPRTVAVCDQCADYIAAHKVPRVITGAFDLQIVHAAAYKALQVRNYRQRQGAHYHARRP